MKFNMCVILDFIFKKNVHVLHASNACSTRFLFEIKKKKGLYMLSAESIACSLQRAISARMHLHACAGICMRALAAHAAPL